MRLTIFGATGRTGRHAVRAALEAGHKVVVLARDPAKVPTEWGQRVRVVKGDATDPAAVKDAVAGADAVIDTLGHTKGSPKDVLARSSGAVVAAMQATGVRRLVILTGAGVPAVGDRPMMRDHLIRWVLARLQPDLLKDSMQRAETVRSSGLDWTIARAPRLVDLPPTGRLYEGPVAPGMKTKLSREDAARWLVEVAASGRQIRGAPAVANA
ncbi:MAG TPA: NAD(P)H-binding protein [Candidatus Thermoplasmatota archaeon]|nr:NAD(P)H-binding protein [Candidatus Thermoplasmatota archaeon]